jgi:hypothetical protein
MNRWPSIIALVMIPCSLNAQSSGSKPRTTDSAFAAMQERGKKAMGVDQYTSTHKFDALPNGGRIELVRDTDDVAGVAQIRAHVRDIAKAFSTGDFSTPEFVHMGEVPGTRVMRAKRSAIAYEPRDVPRGAELLIRTTDPEALRAIHDFMAYQRSAHHAEGMGAMQHP